MDRDKYSKPLSKEELGLGEGKEVMGRGMLIHQEWHRVMANRYEAKSHLVQEHTVQSVC